MKTDWLYLYIPYSQQQQNYITKYTHRDTEQEEDDDDDEKKHTFTG